MKSSAKIIFSLPRDLSNLIFFLLRPSHGRDIGYPAPPAQTPACEIIAPGSSRVFASIFSA